MIFCVGDGVYNGHAVYNIGVFHFAFMCCAGSDLERSGAASICASGMTGVLWALGELDALVDIVDLIGL